MIESEKPIIAKYKSNGSNRTRYDDKIPAIVNMGPNVEAEVNDNTLFEPIRSNTKGRKKNTWIKNGIEQSTSQKSLRKCAICGKLTNHGKRNLYKTLGLDEP